MAQKKARRIGLADLTHDRVRNGILQLIDVAASYCHGEIQTFVGPGDVDEAAHRKAYAKWLAEGKPLQSEFDEAVLSQLAVVLESIEDLRKYVSRRERALIVGPLSRDLQSLYSEYKAAQIDDEELRARVDHCWRARVGAPPSALELSTLCATPIGTPSTAAAERLAEFTLEGVETEARTVQKDQLKTNRLDDSYPARSIRRSGRRGFTRVHGTRDDIPPREVAPRRLVGFLLQDLWGRGDDEIDAANALLDASSAEDAILEILRLARPEDDGLREAIAALLR